MSQVRPKERVGDAAKAVVQLLATGKSFTVDGLRESCGLFPAGGSRGTAPAALQREVNHGAHFFNC
jgi:hypothetical protein